MVVLNLRFSKQKIISIFSGIFMIILWYIWSIWKFHSLSECTHRWGTLFPPPSPLSRNQYNSNLRLWGWSFRGQSRSLLPTCPPPNHNEEIQNRRPRAHCPTSPDLRKYEENRTRQQQHLLARRTYANISAITTCSRRKNCNLTSVCSFHD